MKTSYIKKCQPAIKIIASSAMLVVKPIGTFYVCNKEKHVRLIWLPVVVIRSCTFYSSFSHPYKGVNKVENEVQGSCRCR